MKSVKWFWIVNWLLTLISLFFLVCFIIDLNKFSSLKNVYYLVTLDESITPFLFIMECIQIPLILVILLWKKQERRTLPLFYLFFLITLCVLKIVLYFTTALGFAYGEY